MLKKKIAAALAAVMAVTAVMATSAMAGRMQFGFSFSDGRTTTGREMKSAPTYYATIEVSSSTENIYYQVLNDAGTGVTSRIMVPSGAASSPSYNSGMGLQYNYYRLQGSGGASHTLAAGYFTP